jgi:putative heme transporter
MMGGTGGEAVAVDSQAPDPSPVGTALDEAGGTLVPGWLRLLGAFGWRILVVVAIAVVIGTLAVRLSTVTLSIIFAALLAAAVAPLYRHVRVDRGWSTTKAAAVLSLVALSALVITVTVVVLIVAPYLVELVTMLHAGVAELTAYAASAGVPETATALLGRSIDATEAWITDAIGQLVGPIAEAVTVLILGGFLTFYVIQDGHKAWAIAIRDLDDWRQETLTARGVVALERVGEYLRGTALNAGVGALTTWLYLQVLGVPLAGPIAVFVFLAGFMPYIGPVVSTTFVLLVTLAARDLVATVILLALIVVTSLYQRRLFSRYVRQTMPTQPALIVIALPAGAALFGLIGLIAAVPAVIVAETFAPAIVATLESGRREVAAAGALVPVWLDRLAQWAWRALVIGGVGAIVVGAALQFPGVTLPLVLALVLAATLKPGVQLLRARGLGRAQSALAITVVTATIALAAMAAAVIAIGGSITDTSDLAVAGAQRANVGAAPVDVVRSVGSGLVSEVTAILAGLVGLSLAILLAGLLTYHLLREGDRWWERALSAVAVRRRAVVREAGTRAASVLNGYMVGTGAISLFAGVTQFLIMALLGLPLAFPIGVLTFFGNFIPYIGGFVTTFLGFLVAVAAGSTSDIVIMAIYTLVMNIVQGNFVAPLVYGKTVSLHPAIVLLAIPAGGQIGGIVGMFLVVPFLGVVASTWRLVLHMFDPGGDPETSISGDPPPIDEGAQGAPVPSAAGP